MKSLEDLEKIINSELTTKINSSKIKHEHIYINIDENDLTDVIFFLKTNNEVKFRQFSKLGQNRISTLDDFWVSLLRC